MANVWGNQDASQNAGQNLVSLGNEIIQVTNINDASRTALMAANTNASGKALYALGASELDGRVTVPDQDVDATALHVTNSNTGSSARALQVDGRAEITRTVADEIALLVTNTSDDAEARALKVQGKAEIVRSAADETALLITNTSMDPEARALKVSGMTELVGIDGAQATTALVVTNVNDEEGSYAMVVTGYSSMSGSLDVIRDEQGVAAFHAQNADLNSTARAIVAHGTSELIANNENDDLTTALIVSNASANASARAIVVTGKSVIPTIIGNTSVDGNLTVDGDLSTTEDLNVDGGLTVDQASTLTGAVTASNTLAVTGAATLSSTLAVSGATTLGNTLAVTGAVTVGPNNAAGRIDAVPTGGGAANNLEVGGQGSTADVRLGHANHTIDMFAQTRLNSLGCVVNGAAAVNSLASGAGFIYNGAGHGGGPSIDFYLAGVMVRYVDATGWN